MIHLKRPRTLAAVFLFALLPGCASVLSATRDDDRATLGRLLRHGASPDQGSDEGTTPLFVAIEAGNLPAAKLLVEAGADVNKRSRCRDRMLTPLQKAAVHGDLPIVRYLLDKGADARLVDPRDVFTLMAFDHDPRDSAGITSAIVNNLNAKHGDTAAQKLLDGKVGGWTPLAAAAWADDGPLLQALIANGASLDLLASAKNVDSGSEDEWPPIYFALVAGNDRIVDQLRKAGADFQQTSRDGETSSQIVARLERRREEMAALQRQNRREDEEDSRRTFAAFQQGMAAVAGGVEAGLQEAHETRARQEEARAEYRQSSEANSVRHDAAPVDDSSTSSASASAVGAVGAAAASPDGDGAKGGPSPSASNTPAPEGSHKAAEAGKQDPEAIKQEEARKKEALKQEEARKKEALKQEEARKKEALKQEEARKKEEAVRAGQDYREDLRRSVVVRAQRCRWGAGDYCARSTWPSSVKKRDIAVYVSFRASCDRIIWTNPKFFSGPYIGMSEEEAIEPKPNCPIDQVKVEVVEVK